MNDREFRRRAHALLVKIESLGPDEEADEATVEFCARETMALIAEGDVERSAGLRAALGAFRGKGPFRPYDIAREGNFAATAVPAALRDLGARRCGREALWRIDG